MDGLIDDIITINIDNPCWVERANNAALLIIHTIFISRKSNKPLKQDEPLSLRKIAGEGQFSERNTYLGWDIQTCYLQVLLPQKKETAWVHDIRESLDLTKTNTEKLEYLIGNISHATHIITPARYFLN